MRKYVIFQADLTVSREGAEGKPESASNLQNSCPGEGDIVGFGEARRRELGCRDLGLAKSANRALEKRKI